MSTERVWKAGYLTQCAMLVTMKHNQNPICIPQEEVSQGFEVLFREKIQTDTPLQTDELPWRTTLRSTS